MDCFQDWDTEILEFMKETLRKKDGSTGPKSTVKWILQFLAKAQMNLKMSFPSFSEQDTRRNFMIHYIKRKKNRTTKSRSADHQIDNLLMLQPEVL